MPHLFHASPRGIHGLRVDSVRTPHGLTDCQHGTDPCRTGAWSLCGVRTESEHFSSDSADCLILDDRIMAKSLLADIVAKIEELEALEAEAEGESEVEEDELVEEMVDE